MTNYRINQRVEVVVERILPFGVFARLEDGTEAYIRRRELNLDADVDPAKVVREGEKIEAKIIDLGKHENQLVLSRRATMDDPWREFDLSHSVGDVIRGRVCSLRPGGVFVRIQPGVDGFVSLQELAPTLVEKPEDVLWVGDSVEAVILSIMPSKKHLSLSVKTRLHQYDQALKVAGDISKRPTSPEMVDPVLPSPDHELTADDVTNYQDAGPILIVEDDDQVRDSLQTWFLQKGIQVFTSTSVEDALNSISRPYRIFMIDLQLHDEDGLELISQITKSEHKGYICVMSSMDILTERVDEIQAANVTQVFAKPLDMTEIEQFLSQVAQNIRQPLWHADISKSQTTRTADTFLSLEIRPDTQVKTVLEEIAEMIRADTGILFHMDPATKTATIQSQVGVNRLNEKAIYSLGESPVKDVILERDIVFENCVTRKAKRKFEKLLELLSFDSCTGVPIRVFDEVNHAVFFFGADEKAFSKSSLRDARTGALLLSTLLTDQRIRNQLRSLNPMLVSGELAAGFGHDVFNKITALELESRNMVDLSIADNDHSERILDLVLDLKGTVQAFQHLLQRNEKHEPINVNELLKRAIRLIRATARKEKATIVLNLSSELPVIMGNATYLQQVFFNITINSIQQMALKAEKYSWNGKRTLEISSTIKDAVLQIRFKDNGPGIHEEHRSKLFTPGFSTRGGSGLGLYIALSFIQAMGGRALVEETLVPLGTTFLVELPVEIQEDVA